MSIEAEKLRQMYHDDDMSLREIGAEVGVSGQTIKNWMDKHSIPTRQSTYDKPVFYELENDEGYGRWAHHGRDKQSTILVHRLVAVAKYGIEAVNNMDVHHKNGHKFDNRPENLKLLTREEHIKIHL